MKYTEFSELAIAVEKITMTRALTPTEIKSFDVGQGLDSDLTDILWNPWEELYININGSNKRAVVHICDISNWHWNNRPKFHIYNCSTMKQMVKNNRGHRYKIAGRSDEMFWIITQENSGFKKLYLCSHCRQMYSYNSNQIFNLAEWIEHPIDDDPFINHSYDMTTVKTKYTHDWPEISQKIKVRAKYVCKICRICLISPDTQKYFQVHHEDGNRTNNSLENLTPLCIECHAEQFLHAHMKNSIDYKEYMAAQRYTR